MIVKTNKKPIDTHFDWVRLIISLVFFIFFPSLFFCFVFFFITNLIAHARPPSIIYYIHLARCPDSLLFVLLYTHTYVHVICVIIIITYSFIIIRLCLTFTIILLYALFIFFFVHLLRKLVWIHLISRPNK